MINPPSSLQEIVNQLKGWKRSVHAEIELNKTILEEVKNEERKTDSNYEMLLKELQAQSPEDIQKILCLLSIDGFGPLLEKYGTLSAEAVVQTLMNAISTKLPENCKLARYSKHELLLLLSTETNAAAALLAEQLCKEIASQVIVHNWERFSVTCSIGLVFLPQEREKAEELIALALQAACSATARGGDCVVAI